MQREKEMYQTIFFNISECFEISVFEILRVGCMLQALTQATLAGPRSAIGRAPDS